MNFFYEKPSLGVAERESNSVKTDGHIHVFFIFVVIILTNHWLIKVINIKGFPYGIELGAGLGVAWEVSLSLIYGHSISSIASISSLFIVMVPNPNSSMI